MKRLAMTILLTFVLVAAIHAEAVGSWKVYRCYLDVKGVVPAGKMVYVNGNGNLYSYNTSDNSIKTYTREENGMGGQNMSLMAWNNTARKLVIVYEDYTIDLLSQNDDVETIVWYKQKTMTTDKKVYSIYTLDQYAYLCTAFGLIKIDTRNATIADTYNLDIAVMQMTVKDGKIYLAADNGKLYEAATNANLIDKKVWTESEVNSDELFTTEIQSNEYGLLYNDTYNKCYWGSNAQGMLTKYDKDGTDFVAVSSGVVPDGTITNNCWRIYKHDGKIFVTAGIFSAGLNISRKGMVQYYDGSKWNLLESPGNMSGYDYLATNCMAFDPKDKNHFYVGAQSGLYEYKNYKPVEAYNSNNSALSPLYNSDTSNSNVTSMIYDNNNLWVMNGWCDNFLNRFNSNNESVNFPHKQFSFSNLTTIDIQGTFISPTDGRMYMVNTFSQKSVLYCYTINDDDLTGITTFSNEDGVNISPLYLYDLAEDSEGNLWIASSSGPFYWDRKNIQSGNTIFTQHKVSRNDGTGLADYLMKDIPVRCIGIDAADRKWFGSRGYGVYLISSDNNTELEHFTSKNSPLLSDMIYDIMIDETTGTVWFATDAGICSYQSDVTEDYGTMSSSSVYAYPNPVPPEYTGDITIKGLTNNSQITITTASGYVVHKGICNGGSYRWNGCDQDGERVASGVYMVLVSTDAGEKGCVTKIAMVK